MIYELGDVDLMALKACMSSSGLYVSYCKLVPLPSHWSGVDEDGRRVGCWCSL
jgi:hypothetical protein